MLLFAIKVILHKKWNIIALLIRVDVINYELTWLVTQKDLIS